MRRDPEFPNELLLERAREMRRHPTQAESLLWQHLRRNPEGIKFRRHHPVGPFIVDFFCSRASLAIEIDGEYHFDDQQVEDDSTRTEALLEHGVDVIRFSNKNVMEDLGGVLEKIWHEVRERSPSP
jgi:guanylate kinase